MDTEEKAVISSVHASELNSPFDTFEYGGLVVHSVGLMQAWVRGYTNPNLHMTNEPPAWTEEFYGWLNSHKCEIRENFVGPPMIMFPNRDTANAFKLEWHDKARERYPYKQFKEFLNSQKRPWDERGWKPD